MSKNLSNGDGAGARSCGSRLLAAASMYTTAGRTASAAAAKASPRSTTG
jgi:hypothetical protein